MQRSNNGFGFKGIGNGQGQQRNFGGQPQQPYHNNNNGYADQEQEEVVEWLNIMVVLGNGERKKLGRGIPLREGFPLERAILNMLYDEKGNRKEDAEIIINQLKGAIVLDVRPAGKVDEDVEIDLFGSIGFEEQIEKPSRKPTIAKRSNQAKEAEEPNNDLIDDDIPEELQQQEEKPARTRGRRLGTSK